MKVLSLKVKPPSDLFFLPLNEYLREREARCRESLRVLDLYGPNRDLAPFIVGTWYKQYYEHKLT